MQQNTLQKGHEKIFYDFEMISNEIEKITPRKDTVKLEQAVLGSLSSSHFMTWTSIYKIHSCILAQMTRPF